MNDPRHKMNRGSGMNPNQAEDRPDWNGAVHRYTHCRKCSQLLHHPHCSETGCPWCEVCGAGAAPPSK